MIVRIEHEWETAQDPMPVMIILKPETEAETIIPELLKDKNFSAFYSDEGHLVLEEKIDVPAATNG